MEIIEKSFYWRVSEELRKQNAEVNVQIWKKKIIQEFREDNMRERLITYIFPNSFVLMKWRRV